VPADSRFVVRDASGSPPATVAARALRGTAEDRSAGSSPGVGRPACWLGAEAPGGLALPAALPTAHQLYAPRAVWLDDRRVIVADTGNHRVLIWHEPNPPAQAPADVVLGQVDASHEGPQSDGRGPELGFHLPTGVIVHDGRLLVADAWNHRLLVWDHVPERSDHAPDVVLGQADASSVEENRGEGCGPLGFYWPFGLGVVDDRLYVADTGNRRVLAWDGIPEPNDKPLLVLGQPDPYQRDENRGEVGADSFRWPHDVAGTAERLLIADAGNHRLLGWSPHPMADGPAGIVLGQPDHVTAREFPYQPQTSTSLRFPYAVAIDGGRMAVADTANNRVLLWDRVPDTSGTAADHVLGQPDFAANGENRWDLVAADTLCWPYGLCLHANRLAVADSGNNRVVIWELGG
jgi:hypothetical protein